MDEWQVEMQDIQRDISAMRLRKGDEVIIAELEAELRILQALYATSCDVFEVGQGSAQLRHDFTSRHLGDWTFANVYSFVYERAIEIEPGRRELSSLVAEIDYLGLIRRTA